MASKSNTLYLPGDLLVRINELKIGDIAVGYSRGTLEGRDAKEIQELLEHNGARMGGAQEIIGFGPDAYDIHIKDIGTGREKLWDTVQGGGITWFIIRARKPSDTAKPSIADFPSTCKMCGEAAYEGAFGVTHAIEPSPCTARRA